MFWGSPPSTLASGCRQQGRNSWLPSVDGCCCAAVLRAEEWDRLTVGDRETWFLGNRSLHSTWKSAVSSSCLVPFLSVFSHRILVLEGGKIIAQLKKYPKCLGLFGKTQNFRLSSLFLSAGINLIEGSLQNIYLLCLFPVYFVCIRHP